MHKQVHIHVEEPELSLFPDAQCKLIDAIVRETFRKKEDKRELGVMLATHSPYIVNYLNLLMRRSENNAPSISIRLDSRLVEVYEVLDGCAVPLKSLDERPIIDTRLLSDPIANIYAEFKKY